MRERKLIIIKNTRFIFDTNFSGDPERDSFGSSDRKANVVIPDCEQAMALLEEGFNVRETKPRPGNEDEFEPTYFVAVKINYDSDWPPEIYLVSGDAEPRLLDAETVGNLDSCYVRNVNVVLSPYYNARVNRKSLYVKTMYVEQEIDADPFAHLYRRNM